MTRRSAVLCRCWNATLPSQSAVSIYFDVLPALWNRWISFLAKNFIKILQPSGKSISATHSVSLFIICIVL